VICLVSASKWSNIVTDRPTDLTFDSMADLLRERITDNKILSALDSISGALLVLAPVAFGPSALPSLALIGPKNEVVKASASIIRSLAGKQGDWDRINLLKTVYCLTCYTAFFEAINKSLNDVKDALDIRAEDKIRLVEDALVAISVSDDLMPGSEGVLQNYSITLPHPNQLIDSGSEQLDNLYVSMTKGYKKLIMQFAAWESASGVQKDRIAAIIETLPTKAKELYKSQYLALSKKFPEFAIWANFQEHALTRYELASLGEDVRSALRLFEVQHKEDAKIDVGLSQLAAAIDEACSTLSSTPNLHQAVEDLAIIYRESVAQPVIDDTYEGSIEQNLRYPRKSDIYVPQSFRSIHYDRQKGKLENEELWLNTEVNENLSLFILNHLSSPHSCESPLIVLGQPGSGKSLLTEMLAARLAVSEYSPVRVELRDINPDADLQNQIEEQIRRSTGRDTNWAELVSTCNERPPLVILDGYDELLQASGKVFSTYLMAVSSFQKRERALGRPLRVIITSRVTLIDKAEIPLSSTIVRLEEFDDNRRDEWIAIWNKTNGPYFDAAGIRKFSIQSDSEAANLAKQPLLLLMLALYDSEDNRLASAQTINQSYLYHSLLKRFIRREQLKGEDGNRFRALTDADRNIRSSSDMRRLSVAALGMLNRRAVHILKSDLEKDLQYFSVERETKQLGGAQLSQAELLLGSFFFVHESRSRLLSGGTVEDHGDFAFEFLHNTFGEFLAADWLANLVTSETETIRRLRLDPALAELRHQRLNQKNGLPDSWFASLMSTPLYNRPVVLQLLREWTTHLLNERNRSAEEFVEDFDDLFYSQVRKILDTSQISDMLLGISATPYPDAPIIANFSVYTINLVLLRCVMAGELNVDESRLSTSQYAKPWEVLVDLWKAGLTHEDLVGAASILKSTSSRDGSIKIVAHERFASVTFGDPIVQEFAIGDSIGDDRLALLAGWALQDVQAISAPSIEQLLQLPSVASSNMENELTARLYLRSRAESGAYSLSYEFQLMDRWTRSTAAISKLDGRGMVMQDPEHSAHGLWIDMLFDPAETTTNIWPQVSDIWEGRSSSFDDNLVLFLTGHRAILTANAIAWYRDVQDGVPSSTSSRSRLARIGQGQRKIDLAKKIYSSALRLTISDPAKVSAEVRYEVATLRRPNKKSQAYLFGTEAPLIALASRPRSTLLRVIERSKEVNNFGWINTAINLFGAPGGPSLVLSFGPLNTLTILKAAGQFCDVSEFSEPRSGINGIGRWCLRIAAVEDREEMMHELASVVAVCSYPWLDAIGLEPVFVREAYGEQIERLGAETRRRADALISLYPEGSESC
jgi:hypothetical protein